MLAAGAQAVDYVNWPNSEQPVWLSSGQIRFQSNISAPARDLTPYVMNADGSGIRVASSAEATAPAAPAPTFERLVFDDPYRATTLAVVNADGQRTVISRDAYAPGGAALSPDGSTVVFAEWVGWVYSDGSTLYSVPVDGSSQPHRLTPDSCTLGSSTRSALQGRCFDGTDGADRIVGLKGGDLIIAGSGSDEIRAGDGQNVVQAQWGDDDIRSGSGPDLIAAGPGNDVVRSGAGSDHVDLGPGRDTVFAGRGADYVFANDGERDVIDCGPGRDRAVVDAFDKVVNCEVVERPGG